MLQDITYLVGRVFCDRKFRDLPIDEAIKTAPYGDLTPEQEAAFRAAFQDVYLREAVDEVWESYDTGREMGDIPAASPWYD